MKVWNIKWKYEILNENVKQKYEMKYWIWNKNIEIWNENMKCKYEILNIK